MEFHLLISDRMLQNMFHYAKPPLSVPLFVSQMLDT